MSRIWDWILDHWEIACPIWVTRIVIVAVYVLWGIFHEEHVVRLMAKMGIVEIDEEDETR